MKLKSQEVKPIDFILAHAVIERLNGFDVSGQTGIQIFSLSNHSNYWNFVSNIINRCRDYIAIRNVN